MIVLYRGIVRREREMIFLNTLHDIARRRWLKSRNLSCPKTLFTH